ncbi:MAG: DUF1761 domain-containing protein [Lacinutrix sp.]|uniref:DUF1761 domain-containing protein n=1 Tax=Lacinutrix sp. TaxID=1937692 RepID=UPI003095D013
MEFNYLAILVAAIAPIVIGFLWYNPVFFGNAWMQEAEMTLEKMKSGNMALIFSLTLLLSFVLVFFLQNLTTHQMRVFALAQGELGETETHLAFVQEYGNEFRSFKHGALHGVLAGVFLFFPVIAINGMFERKSWKYIFINSGYWIISLAIMGAIICGWR